ncbi:alpha/beta-hydrolase [Microstroma glucosiphilum]|uniref:Alpha/beta-hydrolase n=1 Tax=Pseudomicrostroma glucosiphilum TaxID=1684307 RepID=A0A316UIF6_9BASI|nr:alpha/beta-hydrolase [Pseudomicrostroma glucosiphilum]PWN24111.1 alpha/beta-hydrolase [Pseudomicrostroma glucosiphilum]
MSSTAQSTPDSAPPQPQVQPLKHVFKEVDGLQIAFDVYLAPSATKERPSPVLIWWHGGGLLQGSRSSLPPHLLAAPTRHGLTVISADYRLAPQTRLPEIVADCRDALACVLSPSFDSLVTGRVDTSKVFLSGSSAGGWLSLLVSSSLAFEKMGIPLVPGAKEKVRGTIPIYPISDITQPFWRTRQRPVSYLGGRVIDGPRELGEFLDPHAPQVANSAPDSKRSSFYHYMIQEALLEELLLTGTGLKGEDVAIAQGLNEGSITSMPPTLIFHGTADDKVPFSQAQSVADALRARDFHVEFVVEEGKDHLYDQDPKEEMKEMYEFVKRLAG